MATNCFLLILALLLTSCGVYDSPIALFNTKALPQGEAIVFGRVKYTWDGEPLHFDWEPDDPTSLQMYLFLLPPPDAGPVHDLLTGDGSFYWHLPPGAYTITATNWNLSGPFAFRRRGLVPHFVIPEDSPLVYIGTLAVSLDGQRSEMRIEDEYAQALKDLKGRFPEIQGEATKRLMHVEKGP